MRSGTLPRILVPSPLEHVEGEKRHSLLRAPARGAGTRRCGDVRQSNFRAAEGLCPPAGEGKRGRPEMRRGRRPVLGGGGQGGGLSKAIFPIGERIKISCSFCEEPFEVLRPTEGGQIRVEVQCSHCGRAGIVAYGEIGGRTLRTERRRWDRRSGRDRRQR